MFNIIKDNLFLWFILFLAVVAPSFLLGAFQLVFVVIAAFVVVVLVGVVWFRWKIRKLQKEGGAAQGHYRYTNDSGQQQRRGGATAEQPDVKIFVNPSDKKVSSDVGDYVDFEEVEDK